MNLGTAAAPLEHPVRGTAVVPLANGSWRVTRRDGTLLGNVEPVNEERGTRYRAKRFTRDRRFRAIGEFWTAHEAVDALRFG